MKKLGVVLGVLLAACWVFADGEALYRQGLESYPTNKVEAYEFFLDAVSAGSVEAMAAIGHFCEEGDGIATNRALAFGWYNMAMQQDAVKTCRGLAAICSVWRGGRRGDLEERTQRFDEHGSNLPAAMDYAEQLLSDGRQLDAEDILDRAIAEYPSTQRVLFLRGVLWRSRFSKSYAAFYFSAVEKMDADSVMGQAAQLTQAMDNGRQVQEGFSQLREMIAQHPGDLFLRWLFAIQSREQRKYAREAAEQYEYILETWETAPVLVHQTYANILTESLMRPEDALKHRRIAVELAPRGWTYQGLANTLMMLGRLEEANEAFEKAVELEPTEPIYVRQRGLALLYAKQYEGADEVLSRLYELDPTDVVALMFRGKQLTDEGRGSESIAALEKAMEAAPEKEYPRSALMLHALFGYEMEPDYEKALALAKSLSKDGDFSWARLVPYRFSSDPDVLYYAGSHRAEMRDDLQKLAEGGNAAACFNLGMVYKEAIGVRPDVVKAEKWLTRAAELGYPQAEHQLEDLRENGGVTVEAIQGAEFSRLLAEAEAGDCKAMYKVGGRYLSGSGVEQDLTKAIEWLDRCGETHGCLNHPYRVLGATYREGRNGAAEDWHEAERWYLKGWEQGDATCYRIVGNMYEEGNTDFPQNIDLAIEIYKQVWDTSPRYHHSARALIDLYCECDDPAYRDPQAAVELALDVVEKHPKNSYCLASLAKAYACNGQFDKAEAQQRDASYREAAYPYNFNRATKDTDAEYDPKGELPPGRRQPAVVETEKDGGKKQVITLRRQAIKCRNAKGEERDIPKAIELYKQAYEIGENPYDAYEVGNLYLWQEPFRDYSLARGWLDKAVSGGFPRAHLCLSEYYYRGYDKDARNGEKAIRHALCAVELNPSDSDSYRILASAYAYSEKYRQAAEAQQKAVELFEATEKTKRYYDSLCKKAELYRQQATHRHLDQTSVGALQ